MTSLLYRTIAEVGSVLQVDETKAHESLSEASKTSKLKRLMEHAFWLEKAGETFLACHVNSRIHVWASECGLRVRFLRGKNCVFLY